jgi:4-amino-4-deoxy-L-arabinose transferase-like glycosyltransferase
MMNRGTLLVLSLAVVYPAILFSLVTVRPLWLDEVIQLAGTTSSNWHTLIQYVRQNPGGAPLGYFTQHWLISIAGFNILTARFVSVLAGAISMVLFVILARRLGMTLATVSIAACFWIVCPLLLRYSLEGRPYTQGLCFALAAILCQLRLSATGSVRWAVAFTICLSAAVYSQSFAVFACLGFSLYDARHASKRCRLLTIAAYIAAALLFMPWFIWAAFHWHKAIIQSQTGFQWRLSLILVVIKECAGDGYAAALPILVLASRRGWSISRRSAIDLRQSLVWIVLCSVALPLIIDAWFNYFFASRQLIYAIPFLLLLAADEVLFLWNTKRARIPCIAVLAIFAIGSIAKDHNYLSDKRENWQRLAAQIDQTIKDGCLILPAGDSGRLYSVFKADLVHRLCGRKILSHRVVLVKNSYTDSQSVQAIQVMLASSKFLRTAVDQVGFGEIDVYTPGK